MYWNLLNSKAPKSFATLKKGWYWYFESNAPDRIELGEDRVVRIYEDDKKLAKQLGRAKLKAEEKAYVEEILDRPTFRLSLAKFFAFMSNPAQQRLVWEKKGGTKLEKKFFANFDDLRLFFQADLDLEHAKGLRRATKNGLVSTSEAELLENFCKAFRSYTPSPEAIREDNSRRRSLLILEHPRYLKLVALAETVSQNFKAD